MCPNGSLLKVGNPVPAIHRIKGGSIISSLKTGLSLVVDPEIAAPTLPIVGNFYTSNKKFIEKFGKLTLLIIFAL